MRKGYTLTAMGQLHYCSSGQGDPIVLLPPSGQSCAFAYANLMKCLSEYHQVIGLDPPGWGRSDPFPSGASMHEIATWLAQALENIGLSSVDVYGLHTGNKLAAALATRAPQQVRGVVLAGLSHSLVSGHEHRQELIYHHVPWLRAGLPSDTQENVLKSWMQKYAELTSLWFNKNLLGKMTSFDELNQRLGPLIDHLEGLAARDALYVANFGYKFEDDLAALKTPTLILELVTPDEQKTIGSQGPGLQRLIKDSRWVTLDEPDMTRPDFAHRAHEIAKIVHDFLSASKLNT